MVIFHSYVNLPEGRSHMISLCLSQAWKKNTLLRVIPTVTFLHFLTGKSSGILSGISSGILSGISSGILSGISSGILSDIPSGISSGILSGISHEVRQGTLGVDTRG